MFHIKKDTTNPIILSNRNNEIIRINEDNYMQIFIPMMKKNNKYLELMGDFILEISIDRSEEINQKAKIDLYFYIFLFFHILFLGIIYFFTKKYYESLQELKKSTNDNLKLLTENKDFIRTICSQIQMPLSIIMNNFSFIERYAIGYESKYTKQVNSAIDMLNNSYNDLQYLVNNEKITYTPKRIDISEFLYKRIEFFNNIVETRHKNIQTNIQINLNIYMSEEELERLIDNNISNAIKHSFENTNIEICLYKKHNEIILSFSSQSREIKNKDKIFDRSFKEIKDSKRSLGIGLSMVKSICLKYNIFYSVNYVNQRNIFIYIFKNSEA